MLIFSISSSSSRAETAALAADDDLFQVVGGGYSDAVFSAVLMGEFFDVLVGCLGFFGVDYVDVMVVQDFGGVALDAVGVEDGDDAAFFGFALIGSRGVGMGG